VHHASQVLLITEPQIGIIALGNGFYDQAHLSELFRRWMGVTPLEFRKGSRQQA
jgi:AraC-like DNA-binding protein